MNLKQNASLSRVQRVVKPGPQSHLPANPGAPPVYRPHPAIVPNPPLVSNQGVAFSRKPFAPPVFQPSIANAIRLPSKPLPVRPGAPTPYKGSSATMQRKPASDRLKQSARRVSQVGGAVGMAAPKAQPVGHNNPIQFRGAYPHQQLFKAVSSPFRSIIQRSENKNEWDWPDEDSWDEPAASISVASSSLASTTTTSAAPYPLGNKSATSLAGVRSTDKRIYRSNSDPKLAFAIAASAGKDAGTSEEARIMREIMAHDVLSVIHGDGPKIYRDPTTNEERVGYPMRWIDGVHSKTNKVAFEWALYDNRNNRSTISCLDALESYVDRHHGIADLQVMFETRTGRLFVIDPRGLSGPGGDKSSINRWRSILAGNVPRVGRENSDYVKFD